MAAGDVRLDPDGCVYRRIRRVDEEPDINLGPELPVLNTVEVEMAKRARAKSIDHSIQEGRRQAAVALEKLALAAERAGDDPRVQALRSQAASAARMANVAWSEIQSEARQTAERIDNAGDRLEDQYKARTTKRSRLIIGVGAAVLLLVGLAIWLWPDAADAKEGVQAASSRCPGYWVHDRSGDELLFGDPLAIGAVIRCVGRA